VFKSPLTSFLQGGGYQFENLKFLETAEHSQPGSDIGPTTLDYQGRVVMPKAPGKLTVTGSTVAKRVGGYQQYVFVVYRSVYVDR
jgi:hypothetical protein